MYKIPWCFLLCYYLTSRYVLTYTYGDYHQFRDQEAEALQLVVFTVTSNWGFLHHYLMLSTAHKKSMPANTISPESSGGRTDFVFDYFWREKFHKDFSLFCNSILAVQEAILPWMLSSFYQHVRFDRAGLAFSHADCGCLHVTVLRCIVKQYWLRLVSWRSRTFHLDGCDL